MRKSSHGGKAGEGKRQIVMSEKRAPDSGRKKEIILENPRKIYN